MNKLSLGSTEPGRQVVRPLFMTRASNRGRSTRLDRVVIALGVTLILGALTAGCGEGGTDASQPSTTADAVTHVPTGVWAGDDLILTVTPEGATAEFACAVCVHSPA